MHDISHHLEWQKKVLCFGKVILAFGPFLGFFWPSEGLRPSSGQKNPKNGPQAKMTLPQHKIFFCPSSWWYCRAFLHETLHFTSLMPAAFHSVKKSKTALLQAKKIKKKTGLRPQKTGNASGLQLKKCPKNSTHPQIIHFWSNRDRELLLRA